MTTEGRDRSAQTWLLVPRREPVFKPDLPNVCAVQRVLA